MATHVAGPSSLSSVRRPRAVDYLVGSFWIADVMVLAMLAFFVLVGDMRPWETAALAAVMGVLALLAVLRITLGREKDVPSRADRERRGF